MKNKNKKLKFEGFRSVKIFVLCVLFALTASSVSATDTTVVWSESHHFYGDIYEATATCPSGYLVTGCGFDTIRWNGTTAEKAGDVVEIYRMHRDKCNAYFKKTNPSASSSNFRVQAICAKIGITKKITVVSPNGGEEWIVGNTYDIKWSSTGVDNVDIEVAFFDSQKNHVGGQVIASNVDAKQGSYSWTIPNDWKYRGCPYYKVVILDSQNRQSINDWSDGYFNIVEKRELNIQISNPRDGETVSGIVRVEATANGPSELNDMFLTISGNQVAEHFKLTDCIVGVAEPLCKEGSECKPTYTKTCWYDWDTSGWEGQKVTLTASISDVEGNRDSDSVRVYEREIL